MRTFGTNLLLVSRTRAYDPNRGYTVVEVYEGTPTAVTTFANSITDPYLSWSIGDNEKPKWTLTIVSPDDVSYQTVWEVAGNDLNKSIYEHARVIATGESNVSKIRHYFKASDETSAMPTFTGTTDAIGDAQEAWRLLKKDTSHYFKAQYVLRSRITGTLDGFPGVVFSPANVGLVFLQQQLLPGGAYALGLPAPIVAFLNLIPAELPAVDPDDEYRWGWLFKTPTITGLPGGKFELRQEWWLELWSKLLYDTAGNAGSAS
jgi:hypothetical protein